MQAIEKLTKRVDGWFNVLTGLGRKGKDKRVHAEFEWVPLSEADADHLYAGDDIAKKIVDLIPDEAMRKGFRLTGTADKETDERLTRKVQDLGTDRAYNSAWKWARQYGGSGVLMITDDLQRIAEPLIPGTPIKGLTVLSRYELVPAYEDLQRDLSKPGFGKPLQYKFYPRGRSVDQFGGTIHASRIIRFDGEPLPRQFEAEQSYWGDSILSALVNAIRNFNTAYDSAASILQDFRVGKFKIKDLADMMAQDKDQDIIRRMEMVRLSKSVCGAIVLDADSEDFEYTVGAVTGIKDLLDKMDARLVTGTPIPHTVLLGQSPVASNGTGNSTVMAWYDYLSSEQEHYLKSRILGLSKLVAASEKIDASNLDVEFLPLWQMDEKELALIRNTQAETDQIYMEAGVIDAREVAMSRFGGEKYSTETEIDKNLRSEIGTAEAIAEAQTDPVTGAPVDPKAVTQQELALNGAQVTSLVSVISSVAQGLLPRDSGIHILALAFNQTPAEAEAMMGSVGKSFTPSAAINPLQSPGRRDQAADPTALGQVYGANGQGEFQINAEKAQAALETISKFHSGAIPQESAALLLVTILNITKAQADEMLGTKAGEVPVGT